MDSQLAFLKNIRRPRYALIAILLIVPLSVVATTRMYRVAASSMTPALVVGDMVVVNLMAYDLKLPFTELSVVTWANPKRDDIVLFSVPNEKYLGLKRIVAVPGDKVELRSNRLAINGQPAAYAPLTQSLDGESRSGALGGEFWIETISGRSTVIRLTTFNLPQSTFGPVLVEPDRYFLLGDNRDNSNDSRIFGALRRDEIRGSVMKVFH